MSDIGIGLIGTGFMGKAHALAYRAAGAVFPDISKPVLRVIADVDGRAAEQAARQYGFERSTADWRTLVADPQVEIVAITTPNRLHKEMALAAIAAGKHVHCEKPLAPNVADAAEMMAAAEAKGVVTQVGFNYLKNPVLKLARDMIAAGELGEITGFRGLHAEDYMANPDTVWSWRLDPSGGPGVVADLGSHIIGLARFLLGPIAALSADLETVVKSRPVAALSRDKKPVLVDDIARLLVRFERGCGGTIEANWVSTGRKMELAFEVHGSKGSLAFTQERFNELWHFKTAGDSRTQGFLRIEAGPQHEPYGRFCVAGGHQIGFNDLKTIEAAEFIAAIDAKAQASPDFREAYEIQRVIEAAVHSSDEKKWVRL